MATASKVVSPDVDRGIVVEQLSREFGDLRAVDAVDLQIPSGEIFGFLGPNGAGKSTLVKMLATILAPTSGRAVVAGFDVRRQQGKVRQVIGVALQDVGLDPLMTARELVVLQAQLFGTSTGDARDTAERLLETVGLANVEPAKRVGDYSGGMKRRLDLALALAHDPRVLFLDEPTTGLDPASRIDIWNEVRRLNSEQGMTIFLTTQYLEEADKLADRVAITTTAVSWRWARRPSSSAASARRSSSSVSRRRTTLNGRPACWPARPLSAGPATAACAATSRWRPMRCRAS